MRIGLITGEYPPLQGGVGDFTRELARALVELGHQVVVITSSQVGVQEDSPAIRVEAIVPKWTRTCWRLIAEAAQRLELDVLNLQYEPAAYAMQVGVNLFPWWYRRQPNPSPVVTTFHDLLVPYLFPKAGRLRWKVVEFLARHSQAVIVTNAEDLLTLTNLQLPISNLHLIPIGSNIYPVLPPGFDRDRERRRRGASANDWLIAYFGFLSMSKGGLTLLRAIGLLLNDGLPARLLLIGGRTGSSDPANAAYAAEVDRALSSLGLRDRVQSTGYVDPAQVSTALAAADVIALPYADGVSFRRGSLMAALAHGKAIVTTWPRVQLPELVDGENCLLVGAEDAAALAAGIRRVLAEPGLRARLEAGALDLARQFTWDKIAARTTDVYSGVV
ncbi:MAG TPA: glycosyltransferase family 4 protein [Anaerolineae bacterium]|nr:glycosyltransferase family 4 protein [Anaerolineae bacterium]